MARKKKYQRAPVAGADQSPGNLALMELIGSWCQGSIPNILKMCDWHVQRETDKGVLGFRAAPGGKAKILVVAHLDYLGTGKVHELDAHHIVSSALDDRLGACLAYNLKHLLDIDADVVFCDKEEIGRSTLPMLGTAMLDKYNWIVEFDRRLEGAVCYQYTVMEPYIKKHFELHQGSFSDICTICHVSPVGAFNMAVGYDNEHGEKCNATTVRVVNQLKRFKAFYAEFCDTKIAHTPPAQTTYQNRQAGGYRRVDFHDNLDSDWWNERGFSGHGDKPKINTHHTPGSKWVQGRGWVSDDKGNVIPMPAKTEPTKPVTTAVSMPPKDDDDVTPLLWKDLHMDDIKWLTKRGWKFDFKLTMFTKNGDTTKPLTMKMFLDLDEDEADNKKMARELKELVADGELSAAEIRAYETIGWKRDPMTGEWYNLGDEDASSN